MARAPETDSVRQLSPFAFPSETDTRFLLLVLIVGGNVFALTGIFVRLWHTSVLLYLVGGLGLTLVVLVGAWLWARGWAKAEIRKEKWKPFPPLSNDPVKEASLLQMEDYIRQTTAQISDLPALPLEYVWDDVSAARDLPTGRAFGFGKKQYVLLREGLHRAFVKPSCLSRFSAVLLHELGHVSNRDVSKTFFSIVLSRCFFTLMTPMLAILNLALLPGLYDALVLQTDFGASWEAVKLMLGMNVKFALILLLAEISRSSVLRVREHYADVRARAWLGNDEPLLQALEESESQCDSPPFAQDDLPSQRPAIGHKVGIRRALTRTLAGIRDKIAPTHPGQRKRVHVLKNAHELFRPSWDAAFLASTLVGLSLNSSASMLSLVLEGGDLLSYLNSLIQDSQSVQFIWIAAALFLLLELLLWIGMLFVLAAFGVTPIVGSIGIEIQKSAFADRFRPTDRPLGSLSKLLGLSLMSGLGVVFGSWLTPVPHFLSLQGVGLLMAPLYILCWAGVLLMWMLPLRWLAGQLYGRHAGETPPTLKRRVLTICAAVALIPLMAVMCLFQVSTSVLITFPGEFSYMTGNILGLAAGSGVVAFLLHWTIWTGAWICTAVFGWLRPPRCPSCQEPYARHSRASEVRDCPKCHQPISDWAWLGDPIILPPSPSPVPSEPDAPPL